MSPVLALRWLYWLCLATATADQCWQRRIPRALRVERGQYKKSGLLVWNGRTARRGAVATCRRVFDCFFNSVFCSNCIHGRALCHIRIEHSFARADLLGPTSCKWHLLLSCLLFSLISFIRFLCFTASFLSILLNLLNILSSSVCKVLFNIFSSFSSSETAILSFVSSIALYPALFTI